MSTLAESRPFLARVSTHAVISVVYYPSPASSVILYQRRLLSFIGLVCYPVSASTVIFIGVDCSPASALTVTLCRETPKHMTMCRVGQNLICMVHIRCFFFSREITKNTVTYSVSKRFWPTLVMCKVGHNRFMSAQNMNVCLCLMAA